MIYNNDNDNDNDNDDNNNRNSYFLYKKMHLNMSSGKWRPFCFGLNMLTGIKNRGIRNHNIL